jgi:hypothetical protein
MGQAEVAGRGCAPAASCAGERTNTKTRMWSRADASQPIVGVVDVVPMESSAGGATGACNERAHAHQGATASVASL